jgi:hypothetical protein
MEMGSLSSSSSSYSSRSTVIVTIQSIQSRQEVGVSPPPGRALNLGKPWCLSRHNPEPGPSSPPSSPSVKPTHGYCLQIPTTDSSLIYYITAQTSKATREVQRAIVNTLQRGPTRQSLTVKTANVCYEHLLEFNLRKWGKVSKRLQRGENWAQLTNQGHIIKYPFFQRLIKQSQSFETSHATAKTTKHTIKTTSSMICKSLSHSLNNLPFVPL